MEQTPKRTQSRRHPAGRTQPVLLRNGNSQVAGNEAIITLVSMGYGIGIIPELVLQNSPMKNKIRIVSTSPPLQPFSIGVCTTADSLRNPIVKAFWQNVKADRKGAHP